MNNEALMIILDRLVILALIAGIFWFSYESYLDPNTPLLPERADQVVIGMVGILGVALGKTWNDRKKE